MLRRWDFAKPHFFGIARVPPGAGRRSHGMPLHLAGMMTGSLVPAASASVPFFCCTDSSYLAVLPMRAAMTLEAAEDGS